jgi:hypothetical protein
MIKRYYNRRAYVLTERTILNHQNTCRSGWSVRRQKRTLCNAMVTTVEVLGGAKHRERENNGLTPENNNEISVVARGARDRSDRLIVHGASRLPPA